MPDDTSTTLGEMLGVPPWDVVATVAAIVGEDPVQWVSPSDHVGCAMAIQVLQGEVRRLEREVVKHKTLLSTKEHRRAVHDAEIQRIAPTPGPFRDAVKTVVRREVEWSLTEDEWERLSSEPCVECGSTERAGGAGLTRIDLFRGYELDNVESRCPGCARAVGRRPGR